MSKKSIEQQVAELTEKQKDTVAKVAVWGTLSLLIVIVPLFVFFFIGLIGIISDLHAVTMEAMMGWYMWGAIILVVLIAYFVTIKVAFPYYSDKKAIYIRKERKNKK